MNYTANYQLPQWVESDRLMMDDFNAAMSQIEQGLTGMEDRLPTVKLREFTITQAAASFPLDLSNLDLSPYAGLRFAACLLYTSCSPPCASLEGSSSPPSAFLTCAKKSVSGGLLR